MNGRLQSVSLFSGYAGLDLALQEYFKPIMYCDIERYSQAMLLSRMDDGLIPFAPIWNDVTTLDGEQFKGLVDAIIGGFPCQDISTAGKGDGLGGKRSGLFYEVVRLTKEIHPTFVFLENVPAIRTRGLEQVIKEFTQMGYDCRWTMLSAASVGANHQRERWFFLAKLSNTLCERLEGQRISSRISQKIYESNSDLPLCKHGRGSEDAKTDRDNFEKRLANSSSIGLEGSGRLSDTIGNEALKRWQTDGTRLSSWKKIWSAEPSVGRVANGTPFRVDRIKALGNGVVPLQAKVAFEKLMGIT